jgi:predicted heme/steroid binding protein
MTLLLVACNTGNENMSENNNQEDMVENNENMNNNMNDNEDKEEMTEEKEMMVFDEESLAKYNGKEGMRAYVAVDGLVYDVTDVAAWQSPHAGRLEPGKDYSEEITQSPHGKKNLEGLPIVGTYETKMNDTMEEMDKEDEIMVFDAESLAKYNGKDGMRAYVAVDGLVYDVTDVAAWQSPHAGRFEPGKDYSEEIKQSPHGKKNLEGLEIVGEYEE